MKAKAQLMINNLSLAQVRNDVNHEFYVAASLMRVEAKVTFKIK